MAGGLAPWCRSVTLLPPLAGSGTISVDEFFGFFKGVKASPFGLRMFSIFDSDNSGEVDFQEFVMCVSPLVCWLCLLRARTRVWGELTARTRVIVLPFLPQDHLECVHHEQR